MTTRTYIPIDKFRVRCEKRAKFVAKNPQQELLIKNKDIPPQYSLKKNVQEIYDQGQLGSCTANAFCTAYRISQQDKTFKPSRLWVYFYERIQEDQEHLEENLTDSGADVVDGESFVQQFGVCSEKLWPYELDMYNANPPARCLIDASKHKLKSYKVIKPNEIKKYISNGHPVLIAIEVYESFETAPIGQVPMPDRQKESLLGGHELCLIGYDDQSKHYEVVNSWSDKWGNKGYCYIPYEYIDNGELCPEITTMSVN